SVQPGVLTLAVPMQRLLAMLNNMDESFLITPSWEAVRDRMATDLWTGASLCSEKPFAYFDGLLGTELLAAVAANASLIVMTWGPGSRSSHPVHRLGCH